MLTAVATIRASQFGAATATFPQGELELAKEEAGPHTGVGLLGADDETPRATSEVEPIRLHEYNATSIVESEGEKPFPTSTPLILNAPVEMTSEVRSLITGHRRRALDILHAIALTKAGIAKLPTHRIRIYLFNDPEENTRKLVYEISVQANAPQAMALWDAMGRTIDLWRDGLPKQLRASLVADWSFHVRWLR